MHLLVLWHWKLHKKLITCSAELDDLAPLGDGVVPVGLFGCSLDSHGVLSAWAQEPVAPNSHGQGHRLGNQLGRHILGEEGEEGRNDEEDGDRKEVGG